MTDASKDVRDMDEGQIQDLIRETQENDYKVDKHSAISEVTEDWNGPIRAGFAKNLGGDGPTRYHTEKAVSVDVEKAFGKEVAPAKRTPNERLNSFTSRLWDEAQRNPELMDKLLRRIQGEAWKQGKTVTYTELQAIAASFLQKAERA